MIANNKWFLAKYEPASSVGAYKWDYKFDNNIEALRLINRYLIKKNKLFSFLNNKGHYFYILKPIEGHSKIQKLLCERNLQKKGFKELNYSYMKDEKDYTPFVSEEIRTIKYFYKNLTKYDEEQFILDLFNESSDTVILFSEEDISNNLMVNYLKNEELHLWRNKEADGILNFLSEKRIGLVYKHGYFFHEEATVRPELEEMVFICYVPWRLT
ncbi:hypothetical protein COJ21_26075 [Priestia megaterium]|uniref:hypothetical protein n=1 Tax=Priestia megaterium TaxID=1404 RepID=UPI000BF26741|nr:hypothetical protein [Priestia megaterium]PFK64619.1 hypothetical protein COJ21_26075 [Priestia megaterium]